MKKLVLTAWIVFALFIGGLHAQEKDSLTFVGAKWNTRQLAEGVEWRSYHFTGNDKLFGANQYINLIVVDQDKAKGRFTLADGKGSKVRTSDAAKAAGALAAINGSFYNTKPPYNSTSYLRIDGKDFTEPQQTGYFILIDENGRLKIEPSNLSENTPTFISSLLFLVAYGEKRLITDDSDTYNPRTGMATKGNKVFMLVVDGRNNKSRGVTLNEFVALFKWLDAETAVNLDGGGSTTMYVRGEADNGVVNHPSDTFFGFNHRGERSVGNCILLLDSNTASK